MKAIIFTILLSISMTAHPSDYFEVYADIYKPDTVGIGFSGVNLETSINGSFFSIGGRKGWGDNNIEFGVQGMLTNKTNIDRFIGLSGGLGITVNPYAKIGSRFYGMIELDEYNALVAQIGLEF